MTTPAEEDARLVQVTEVCLGLPETTRQVTGQHARFLVRAKSFAYYLYNHHGDGKIALCCKAAPGINTMLAHSDPARFYLPAYLGPQGWMALRLDVGELDMDEVAAFVTDSYRLVAPKRLAATVKPPLDDPVDPA